MCPVHSSLDCHLDVNWDTMSALCMCDAETRADDDQMLTPSLRTMSPTAL
jgi:hypothetical protein